MRLVSAHAALALTGLIASCKSEERAPMLPPVAPAQVAPTAPAPPPVVDAAPAPTPPRPTSAAVAGLTGVDKLAGLWRDRYNSEGSKGTNTLMVMDDGRYRYSSIPSHGTGCAFAGTATLDAATATLTLHIDEDSCGHLPRETRVDKQIVNFSPRELRWMSEAGVESLETFVKN